MSPLLPVDRILELEGLHQFSCGAVEAMDNYDAWPCPTETRRALDLHEGVRDLAVLLGGAAQVHGVRLPR
jgi:hypothetical protein